MLSCFASVHGVLISEALIRAKVAICFCYALDTEGHHWKMCKSFGRNTSRILDIQFGDGQTNLKLVSLVVTCLELAFLSK